MIVRTAPALASLQPTPDQAAAASQWATLLLVLLLLGLVLIVTLVLIVLIRRRVSESKTGASRAEIPDAWEEAGRRTQPPAAESGEES